MVQCNNRSSPRSGKPLNCVKSAYLDATRPIHAAPTRPARRWRAHPAESAAMAARPIWNGTLSFGLLNIPIQLMTGERTQRAALPDDGCAQQGAGEVRARQRRDGRGSALEGNRQGLRVLQGQLRGARTRGPRERREREPRGDRHRGLRRPRSDHAGLHRETLRARARQESREGLRAAARSAEEDRQGRHRPRGASARRNTWRWCFRRKTRCC